MLSTTTNKKFSHNFSRISIIFSISPSSRKISGYLKLPSRERHFHGNLQVAISQGENKHRGRRLFLSYSSSQHTHTHTHTNTPSHTYTHTKSKTHTQTKYTHHSNKLFICLSLRSFIPFQFVNFAFSFVTLIIVFDTRCLKLNMQIYVRSSNIKKII